MKECVDCGYNEIVKNCNTGKIFCYDCKSEKVYGQCYECKKPIKTGNDIKLDGSDGWHDDLKWIKYSKYSDELVTCWDNHLIDEAVEADCS